MVFGRGKKEIEVTIDKSSYSPGDTISGKLVLNLKKPVDARALRVELIGDVRSIHMGGMGMRRGHMHHSSGRGYNFKMDLDGEKTYSGGEHEFQLKIPQTLQAPGQGGAAGAMRAIGAMMGSFSSVSWYVRGVLDKSGRDIQSRKIHINIA